MASKKKTELGKGIRALLSTIDEETKKDKKTVVNKLSNTIAMLSVGQVETNPWQPRIEFDEKALKELAASIKVHGLIQPITVRRLSAKKYQLISGERRWRASQKAGLKEVPAYIRLANDQEMLEMALIENIQRENLNAVEVAITYQRLKDECDLTDELLSERVGKERSTITNYLRLLKLPPEIQKGIKEKKISMGHARALAGIDDIALQLTIFHEVVDNALSVRKTEELIRQYSTNKPKSTKSSGRKLSSEYKSVQDNLSSMLGTKVALKPGKDGKGQIVINFMSDDDLNRILEVMED